MRLPDVSPISSSTNTALGPVTKVSVGRAVVVTLALILGVGCCKNNKPAALPNAETQSTAQAVQTPPAATGGAPTTKQACDACDGKWARHGLGEQETCICKTKDGGKACRDGADCTGQCIAADDAAFEVTEKGPPPKGYWRGKCSEYDTTFGCHRTIPSGAKSRPPLSKEDAADNICID